ncbi:MAG: Ig-like domain-containing protein [Pseudomonadota bacterium]
MQITRKVGFIGGLYFAILFALPYGCGFVDSGGSGLNDPPTVTPTDLIVNEQETVNLDSSSIVADDFGDIVDYQWTQTAGETVVLNGVDQPIATFTAPTVLLSENEKVLTFELIVTDNFGTKGTGELRVNVRPVNASPRASDDPGIIADEGAAVTIDVVANDTDSDGTIDSTTVAIVTAPANGSAALNSNGTVTYKHDSSETTADSFTYTVKDNESGMSNAATVSITIKPVNDDPTISNIPNQLTRENIPVGPISFTLGDAETPADSLKVSAISSNQALILNTSIVLGGSGANRTTTLLPAQNQSGTTTISMSVSDGEGGVGTDTFLVTVLPINNAPIAINDSFAVNSNSIGNVLNVLTNDSDPDGNTLTITAVGPTSRGGTIINAGSNLIYTPAPGFVGTEGFTYTISDGNGGTATAVVTVTVTSSSDDDDKGKDKDKDKDDDDDDDDVANTANLINSSSVVTGCWTTAQDQALRATLRDAQASTLATYSIVASGTKGTVRIIDPTTGAFEYSPKPVGARGEDTFVYQVDDPRSGVSQKTATVIIIPKLMPLGDGITAGLMDGVQQLPEEGQRVGYRAPLAEALTAAGYRFDLVGSQHPGVGVAAFDAEAEAHVDWSALELAYGRVLDGSDGIYAWLQANPSDIVLLHTGSRGLNPSDVESILDEIDRWETSAQGNPVTVIVARIIDQVPVNPAVSLFNTNLEALVQNRVGNPDHPGYPDRLVMVDQQAALSYPEDLSDGQYPNAAGYANMAEVWLEALTGGQSNPLPRCP